MDLSSEGALISDYLMLDYKDYLISEPIDYLMSELSMF